MTTNGPQSPQTPGIGKYAPLPWALRLHGQPQSPAPSGTCTPNVKPKEPYRPWWKESVFYQVWPRSFKDSSTTNNHGHGDIKGVISKLPYIKGLGVDTLWLCPTYMSPQKDYGYDISDYEAIDPDFGTMEDMDELIAQAKSLGMRVILDLVINHTSEEHPWFLESKSSKDNPKADWYIWRDPKKDHNGNVLYHSNGEPQEPTNWRACLIHGSAWTYGPERQQFYLHCFLEEQPDLNWSNEDCRKAIYESAIEFWMKKGVAGFRVDTANRMSKDMTFQDAKVTKHDVPWQDMSDHCLNGECMHDYLQEMRREAMDKYDYDAVLVGELPGTKPDALKKYVLRERRELSMTFDFDMMVRFLSIGPGYLAVSDKIYRSSAATITRTKSTSTW